MTLIFQFRGRRLTQAQLNAIVPVINERMRKRTNSHRFEDACIKAMSDAGCPLETPTLPTDSRDTSKENAPHG